MRAVHLVRRFAATAAGRGPSEIDVAWARQRLSASELDLWVRMTPADRRHSVAVARWVDRNVTTQPPAEVLRAALLHDVGKADARLGVLGRVGAALIPASYKDRMPGRIGRYLQYPELGAEALAHAGSDPLVVSWAREHHLPPPRWTVPESVGKVLQAADNAG